MFIARLAFFLMPVLLSVTEAVLRSIYLRDISPRVHNKRDFYIDRHTSCAMKAFQSFKGYSNITKMLLDTSSCSLVETLNAQKSSEETSLWEIWKYRELQTDEMYIEEPAMIISCEKPLKLVSPNSDVYSFTFPELYQQGIFSWKARFKAELYFLRCDTTSDTILPISHRSIFYGTWAGNNPNISCLTTVPRRILNVAVETVTKTLYWTQKSADNDENMELYRIHYNRLGKKKMVTRFEAFTGFAVDHSQQYIYVCAGTLARFTMQGSLENIVTRLGGTKCSAVALYNKVLYIHTTTSDGIMYPINSTKTCGEFPMKHVCAKPCLSQVFEAPLPYKFIFPKD